MDTSHRTEELARLGELLLRLRFRPAEAWGLLDETGLRAILEKAVRSAETRWSGARGRSGDARSSRDELLSELLLRMVAEGELARCVEVVLSTNPIEPEREVQALVYRTALFRARDILLPRSGFTAREHPGELAVTTAVGPGEGARERHERLAGAALLSAAYRLRDAGVLSADQVARWEQLRVWRRGGEGDTAKLADVWGTSPAAADVAFQRAHQRIVRELLTMAARPEAAEPVVDALIRARSERVVTADEAVELLFWAGAMGAVAGPILAQIQPVRAWEARPYTAAEAREALGLRGGRALGVRMEGAVDRLDVWALTLRPARRVGRA